MATITTSDPLGQQTFFRLIATCDGPSGWRYIIPNSNAAWETSTIAGGAEPSVADCTSETINYQTYGTYLVSPGVRPMTVSFTVGASPLMPPDESMPGDAEGFEPNPDMKQGGDPVQTLTGNFNYSRTDVAIAGRGPTPTFVRTYNSSDTRDGILGPGWTHNYAARLRTPAGSTNGDLVFVGPKGRGDRFTYQPSLGDYAPPEKVDTRLVRNADYSFTVAQRDGGAWLFDANGRLTAIRDKHGNQSNLTYDGDRLVGVSDPAGRGSLTFTYHPNGRLHRVTDWLTPTARTVEYGYDAALPSRLGTVKDRENNTTTFGYDGTSQRLASITDARGHVALSMTYDAQGRVKDQKDARGQTTGQQTTFAYVTNADGSKTTTIESPSASLDPTWRPSIADTYDSLGRIIRRVSKPTSNPADDVTKAYTYDAKSNRSTSTDGLGNTARFCYDVDERGQAVIGSRRNLTRRIDPAPEAGGNVLVTLLSYDLKNNVVRTIPPKGVVSSPTTSCVTDLSAGLNTVYATIYVYDAAKAKPLSSSHSYTDPDNPSQVIAATTKFEYAAAHPGLLSRAIPPRGNTGATPDYTYATSSAYFETGPKAGLLESVTDPLGNKTSFDYDAVGRRTSMIDPNGHATGANPAEYRWEYAYDNEDRVRFTRSPVPTPGGSRLVSEARYDAVGNRTAATDANGQVTRYLYDERDGLMEAWESPTPWTDPNATPSPKIVTGYEYDDLGFLRRVTRAKGDAAYERVIDYEHDGLGRLRREVEFPNWPSTNGQLVRQATYDVNGNPRSVTDPLGLTTSLSYDVLGRLKQVAYVDGTPNVSYAYGAQSRLTRMTDGTGETTYQYDEQGRVLAVTSPGPKTVGYRYDRDGHRTRLIYPDATAVTYAVDKGGRLSSATDWANRVTSFQYEASGALKQQANHNGTRAAYQYDRARRLTELHNEKGGSPPETITRHAFTLDAVGNRLTVDELLAPMTPAAPPSGTPASAPGTRLTPPSAGAPAAAPATRMSGAPLPGTPNPYPTRSAASPTTHTRTYGYDRLYRLTDVDNGQTTYAYDPVGNRRTRTRGGSQTQYEYDRADRITAAGGIGYTVNANGNLTLRGQADAFEYDQANRLKTVKDPATGAVRASYTYDGAGKRTSKMVSGATTSYVYDVTSRLPVLLDDGSRKYVWANGLAYSVEASGVLVYHEDGLGSVRALTDASARVVQIYDTDEFGVPTQAQGSASQPFGYTGEQRDDESGLQYLRARMYDPSIGRFLTRDSYAGSPLSSKTLNRYAYANQNPCTLTDPSGHKAQSLADCGTPPPIPEVPDGIDASLLLQQNMERSRRASDITFINLVRPWGDWDYKNRWDPADTTRYQDFGNFHFGVVAGARGYTQGTAGRGAGAVQMGQNLWRWVWGQYTAPSEGTPWGDPPFGDDPRDYFAMAQGYLYYVWYTCMQSVA